MSINQNKFVVVERRSRNGKRVYSVYFNNKLIIQTFQQRVAEFYQGK